MINEHIKYVEISQLFSRVAAPSAILKKYPHAAGDIMEALTAYFTYHDPESKDAKLIKEHIEITWQPMFLAKLMASNAIEKKAKYTAAADKTIDEQIKGLFTSQNRILAQFKGAAGYEEIKVDEEFETFKKFKPTLVDGTEKSNFASKFFRQSDSAPIVTNGAPTYYVYEAEYVNDLLKTYEFISGIDFASTENYLSFSGAAGTKPEDSAGFNVFKEMIEIVLKDVPATKNVAIRIHQGEGYPIFDYAKYTMDTNSADEYIEKSMSPMKYGLLNSDKFYQQCNNYQRKWSEAQPLPIKYFANSQTS